MLFIEHSNRDPYTNHALEEWLMQRFDEDCFMLWRNEKSILLGKNQNVYSEINLPYAEKHGIKIVRRMTGGGTVFTDEDNIMFTFISNDGQQDFADFRKFTTPILEALQALGIPAEFTGRNDLTIKGKKFSGNAQCRYGGKVLHHGTLMYQADISELMKALKVSKIKLQSKGVDSVKSRVTNICDHMEKPMKTEDFRQYLFQRILKRTKGAKMFRLSADDWQEVETIRQEKYIKEDWIYGRSPRFNIEKETKLPGGIVQCYLEVKKGNIEEISIYGDYFHDLEVSEIELALTGVLYEKKNVRQVLQSFSIDHYFKNITIDELLTALI